MAAQVSHNVVTESESASAPVLADVAANQINPVSADAGKRDSELQQDTNEDITGSQNANESASDVNAAATSDKQLRGDESAVVAEPSAGDAALAAPGSGLLESVNTEDGTGNAGQGDVGTSDAVSHEIAVEDGSVTDTLGENSVHSDTDSSRADAPGLKKDDSHHTRTNSVKKPTTFSKVSITKSFLAKTATPTPVAAKTGDKSSLTSAAAQLVAKPRLIAKTGSSLQTVQKARLGAPTTNTPDASKVWNKNRPVAAPPPKHFTDEELKQQYGIHLATRLQSDQNGKESTWADIDEDDEDWTPEAVVWMDGTKSTPAPAPVEPVVLPVQTEENPATPQVQPAKPAEGIKPSLAAMKKPAEQGPPKTILKPGIAALQNKQSNGVISTGEKPSLKAKDSFGPAKSPWAVLPPVETMSPVNAPIQMQQQSTRLPTQDARLPPQDARAYNQDTSAGPAREIAADTFDRSWRDGEGGARELFNSANGRYEPAPEGRRTSMRQDSSFRKPIVLHKPSQNGVPPSEGSALSQTRSNTQMDGPGHRRGSSVSQNSALSVRRMSMSRGSDLPSTDERHSSLASGSDTLPSPRMARREPSGASFPQQSTWDSQMPPKPEAGPEMEDPVKVQERVMKEKRELAKKRREEENKKLEDEKAERIKAKLAALGGAGKSRKEREAEAKAAAVPANAPAPTQAATLKDTDKAETKAPASALVDVKVASESEAVPAIVQQSSVLPQEQQPKLDQAEAAKPSNTQSLQPQHLEAAPSRASAPTEQPSHQTPRQHLSPRASARQATAQQSPSAYKAPTAAYPASADRKSAPFGRSPGQDAFNGWSSNGSGNVWGNSGIGNGTFEKSSSFAPMMLLQQGSALPPPPGMQRPSTSTRVSPQGFGQDVQSPSLQQQQLAEQQRSFAPPGLDSRNESGWSTSRSNGVSPAPGLGRQAHLPGPIGPPSRTPQQQQPVQRPDPVTAWKNAANSLPAQYAAGATTVEKPKSAPCEDVVRETFKQTSTTGKLGAPRAYTKTEYSVHDAQGTRSVSAHDPVPPHMKALKTAPASASGESGESIVRLPENDFGHQAQQQPIGPPHLQQQTADKAYKSNVNFAAEPLAGMVVVVSKEQSPPPPEASSHPAFINSSGRPNVRLPPLTPVVKLPPSISHMQGQRALANTPQRPAHGWAPTGAARPLVQSEDWQQRFNGLFNRAQTTTEVPPSPPRTPPKAQEPARAITSSSRGVMDETPASASATVSLPQGTAESKRKTSPEGFTIDDSADVVSKDAMDYIFNEELSFGSVPKINPPRQPMYGAELYRLAKVNLLRMSPQAGRHGPPIDVRSYVEITFERHPHGIMLNIPGSKLINKVVKYAGPARSAHNPAFNNAKHDRKTSGKFNKGREGGHAPSNAQNTGPRQQGFQKAPVPAQHSAPGSNSLPNGAESGSGGNRKAPRWVKAPKGAPRGSVAAATE